VLSPLSPPTSGTLSFYFSKTKKLVGGYAQKLSKNKTCFLLQKYPLTCWGLFYIQKNKKHNTCFVLQKYSLVGGFFTFENVTHIWPITLGFFAKIPPICSKNYKLLQYSEY
jgi:hypothetical protein